MIKQQLLALGGAARLASIESLDLVHTRLAETPQLHPREPARGDRRQLTFFKDDVRAASFPGHRLLRCDRASCGAAAGVRGRTGVVKMMQECNKL